MTFDFSDKPLDLVRLKEDLTSPYCGGYSSFEGWVRDHNEGHQVEALEYEAYEALAVKEGHRIIDEALDRFDITKAKCVHRVGALGIGDLAVWVGVSAAHRDAAFKACRYIIDQVKVRVPIWKKEHYPDGHSGWVNCEHCHTHGQEWKGDYSRQTQLPQIGLEGQKKLENSRVLIIGAGGLGCPALSYLAGAGIGQIGIVDDDVLDASNLHRQTIYETQDLGQPKALLAGEYAKRLNPNISVELCQERLKPREMRDWFQRYDLILDCTDNPSSKQLISHVALLAEKPVVAASVYQYEGQLQVYGTTEQALCYRCVWPDSQEQSSALSCEESGVLGPVPGVFGCLQALEAIKVLLNFNDQLGNDILLFNMMTFESRRIACKKRCGKDGHVCLRDISLDNYEKQDRLEVTYPDLQHAQAENLVVVDIRNPDEIATKPLEGAIPLNLTYVDWNSEENYLLVCAKGVRSKAMANELGEQGIRAFSLKGGVAAWL